MKKIEIPANVFTPEQLHLINGIYEKEMWNGVNYQVDLITVLSESELKDIALRLTRALSPGLIYEYEFIEEIAVLEIHVGCL